MGMKKRKKSKPQYKKEPEGINMEITARDEKMLLALYRYNFLDRKQLMFFAESTSVDGIRKRLKYMHHTSFIHRSSGQKVLGNRNRIYCLDTKGVEWLRLKYHLPFTQSDRERYRETSNRMKGINLEHAVDTASQLIAFEQAAMARKYASYIPRWRILDRGLAEPLDGPRTRALSMKVRIKWNRTVVDVGVEADDLFGLQFLGADGKHINDFIFLEMDEGTMPIVRSVLSTSSIIKNLRCYSAAKRQNKHEKFAIPNFRVLFVTTSWDRVKSMQICWRSHREELLSASYFIFTTKTEMADKDPLDGETRFEDAAGRAVFFDPSVIRQKLAV